MQTAQPHMGSRNSTWPLSLVFFASHTCFNQSEHLCRLVSKRAGRKKLLYNVVSPYLNRLEEAIYTRRQCPEEPHNVSLLCRRSPGNSVG